jgi:hypothetical protein
MDATGTISILTSADGTASYVVANSPQGRVVLSGPYATVAEATKAIHIPL